MTTDHQKEIVGEKSGFRFTGKMFLALIVGFFAIVITVNIIMVRFALGSFDGLVEEEAYVKGRDYNSVLEAAALQHSLGWDSALSVEGGHENLVLRLMMKAANGEPLTGLVPELELRRPARSDLDKSLKMVETGEKGVYQAVTALPLSGRWQVRLMITDLENRHYREDHEFFIRSKQAPTP